jgi:hypothetical protein
MGTQRSVASKRGAVACLAFALSLAPQAALAQSAKTVPFETAFSNFARTWATEHVPDPQAFDRPLPIAQLFSARALATRSRIALADGPRLVGASRRAGAASDDGTNWVLARPLDGFANGFDAFGNPAVGPVDVRGQARNYVRQRIVTEILSKTALGRSLSVFVDTGRAGQDPDRSRLLPFISPKVNAREGKAAITLTWKF